MAFNFGNLAPQIREILSAPGTDLSTISARRVRNRLAELYPSLATQLKENKALVDTVIANVYAEVSGDSAAQASEGGEGQTIQDPTPSRKRKQEDDSEYGEDEKTQKEEEGETPPPVKKVKKVAKGGKDLSDAELARKLSSEINGRSTRGAGKGRVATNGTPKKAARTKKSAAIVESDDSDDDVPGTKKGKTKKKSSTGAGPKGGFAKEYALSEPLAAVLQINKLSRPQVVKQLWVYIKGNSLQNPTNGREIVCDDRLRAVFGVDKIDMIRMNKVLGQHLHESDG